MCSLFRKSFGLNGIILQVQSDPLKVNECPQHRKLIEGEYIKGQPVTSIAPVLEFNNSVNDVC